MTLKKIARNFALHLLMVGASLIIGLLSFGGMFALWPIIPLALATFVLSVAYETEIYLQNIKGAWNKLFKHNALKRQLAKDYLLDNFPEEVEAHQHEDHDDHSKHEHLEHDHGKCKNEEHEEEHHHGDHQHDDHEQPLLSRPQFFTDYDIQLELLHRFDHKKLNAESKASKKQIEKTLRDMEKWFSLQLFAANEPGNTPYETALRNWIMDPTRVARRDEIKQTLQNQQTSFGWAKYFSLFAGIFMTLGTTYLLVETFSIIPFLAAIPFASLPLLILPMAVIAGTAYGFLTYNTTTDMLKDGTIQEWLKYLGIEKREVNNTAPENETKEQALKKTTDSIADSIGGRIMAWILIALAIGLTLCTAGTWWTVVKETRPLFNWLVKIPSLIIVLSNAIIIGLSQLAFNLVNTRESWEIILNIVAKFSDTLAYLANLITKTYGKLREHENPLQVFNPLRILLILIIIPLRVLLFIGHLVSIGVTADRIPGIPQIISAFLGFISEFFEDLHYFFGHAHPEHADHGNEEQGHHHEQEHKKALRMERLGKGHGHNHDLDIPTKVLKFFFTYIVPLYSLAVLWDWGCSQMNSGTRAQHAPYPTFSYQEWEHQQEHSETYDNKTPYPLSYDEAAEKMGFQKEQHVPVPSIRPSTEWIKTHTIYRIERYKEKQNPTPEENTALTELQGKLQAEEANVEGIRTTLTDAATANPVYNSQRFFNNTPVAAFLRDEVQQRVGLAARG
jgi:hypothetical protein